MNLVRNYLFSILLLAPLAIFALPSDNKEKVYIYADSFVHNYKTGIDVYTGHVKVDQGSTHIRADQLITKKNAAHKIHEAIAYGTQDLAHYWTLPKVGDPIIDAHAKSIKYYPIDSNAVLEQNVVIIQGENKFQGEMLQYNSYDQTITLPPTGKGQAVIVYDPDK